MSASTQPRTSCRTSCGSQTSCRKAELHFLRFANCHDGHVDVDRKLCEHTILPPRHRLSETSYACAFASQVKHAPTVNELKKPRCTCAGLKASPLMITRLDSAGGVVGPNIRLGSLKSISWPGGRSIVNSSPSERVRTTSANI